MDGDLALIFGFILAIVMLVLPFALSLIHI